MFLFLVICLKTDQRQVKPVFLIVRIAFRVRSIFISLASFYIPIYSI